MQPRPAPGVRDVEQLHPLCRHLSTDGLGSKTARNLFSNQSFLARFKVSLTRPAASGVPTPSPRRIGFRLAKWYGGIQGFLPLLATPALRYAKNFSSCGYNISKPTKPPTRRGGIKLNHLDSSVLKQFKGVCAKLICNDRFCSHRRSILKDL